MIIKVRKNTMFNLYQYSLLFLLFPIILVACGLDKMQNYTWYFIFGIIFIAIYFLFWNIKIIKQMYDNDKGKSIHIDNQFIRFYIGTSLVNTFKILDIKSITTLLPHSVKVWSFYRIELLLPNDDIFNISSLMFKNDEEYEKFKSYFHHSSINIKFVKLKDIYAY